MKKVLLSALQSVGLCLRENVMRITAGN